MYFWRSEFRGLPEPETLEEVEQQFPHIPSLEAHAYLRKHEIKEDEMPKYKNKILLLISLLLSFKGLCAMADVSATPMSEELQRNEVEKKYAETLAEENSHKSSGVVITIPGMAKTMVAMPEDGMKKHIGHEAASTLHYPGREYRSGTGWWALSCKKGQGCELAAVSLNAKSKLHDAYDSPDVPGQLLMFTPAQPDSLLFLKPKAEVVNVLPLNAGAVTTWHWSGGDERETGNMRHRTVSPGSMEREVTLPSGEVMQWIPVLTLPDPKKPPKDSWDSSEDPLRLELRMNGKRQVLQQLSYRELGERYSINLDNILLWIGDMDGDGKPDFLLSGFKLFLSSLAKEGELAGEAGAFSYADITDSGC